MKQTLLSSLLFFYPINVAHSHNDALMLNLNAGALAASLVNHSHTFHPDDTRRSLFGLIDEKYMMSFTLFITWRCMRKSPTWECFFRVGGNFALVVFIYFYFLEGYKRRKRSVESYNQKQPYIHMLMHFVAIVGLTRAYKTYYYLER